MERGYLHNQLGALVFTQVVNEGFAVERASSQQRRTLRVETQSHDTSLQKDKIKYLMASVTEEEELIHPDSE